MTDRFLNKKILIVEDDNFLSEMIAKKLINEGATIDHASDGEIGLTIAKTNFYDLILLDILLPKKTGFDLLRELREDKKRKDANVVILSNLGQKSDIDMGTKLGVKNFLVKALFSLDEIVDGIANTLNR